MAISASKTRTEDKPTAARGKTPDVRAIMAGIRRTVRERAREGGGGEREFRADLRKRMMQPLTARAFSEDFVERVRSRDSARWNIALRPKELHRAESLPTRLSRALLRPLVRLSINLDPALKLAARQAEINEYHRRLLWATNRDLEVTRRELDLLKRELGRLGVHADLSFSSRPASRRGGGRRNPGFARSRDSRSGGPDRGRGGRRWTPG